MRDFKTLAFYDEWERYMIGDGTEAGEINEDEGEDELYEKSEGHAEGDTGVELR
jgi:hypothetical protein